MCLKFIAELSVRTFGRLNNIDFVRVPLNADPRVLTSPSGSSHLLTPSSNNVKPDNRCAITSSKPISSEVVAKGFFNSLLANAK
jgi:hypothetical protein